MTRAELIERLEKATGPGRELDDLVGASAYGTEPIGPFSPGSKADKRLPRYTASLDAAVALVERMLPDWQYGVEHRRAGATAWIAPNEDSARTAGATLAVALLISLLRALEAKDQR